MGRIYSVPYSGTLTNAGGDSDLLEVLPADDKPVSLRGWSIGQISDVGDAASEGIRISVIRLPATVTSGSGGSAVTPVVMDSADVAAGAACEANNTTVATTSGTAVTIAEIGWLIQATPFEMWFPDPAFAPKVKQGEGLVVRCQTTVADDVTIACTFWIEEH
jgi:hypothetical protein